MDCPACHTSCQPGQKFCGACGHKLQKGCSHCGATNPPGYHFCGRCGHNLAVSGALALMRSGLIAEIDQKAAALIGNQKEDMTGKPFSLYVAREDLPVFFSHWNELLSTGTTQTVELALRHRKGHKIYVQAECGVEENPVQAFELVHLRLSDVSARKMALNQLQYQQDLLHLIYTLAENLRTVSKHHLGSTMTDALKKISLFTKADRCFVYSINRSMKRLEIYQQWCQPSSPAGRAKFKAVPLSMIKRSIIRLRKEHVYIVDDVSRLAPAERYELLTWHHADLGAVMCHLIYSRGQPIGIVGTARNQTNEPWSEDCIALVKLFGQIVSDLLPLPSEADSKKTSAKTPAANGFPFTDLHLNDLGPTRPEGNSRQPQHAKHPKPTQVMQKNHRTTPAEDVKRLPDVGKPMQLKLLTADKPQDQQTVFQRDDGLILLTCPYCGIQESVTNAQFQKIGNAVQVQCSCHKQFAAVLEKRRSYRKPVQLEGYFTIVDETGTNNAKGSIWGLMTVKNLSKTGMRFYAKQVDLIHPGDLLMVRFNLDNSNQALIHKKVEVISINGNEVGCRFKEADQYDITLGFYFI